jgi:hypothetical protein
MKLLLLGHCYEPDHHDKIWGLIEEKESVLSFWGRRGGSMSFKRYAFRHEAMNTWRSKTKKYNLVGPESWPKLLPADFEGQVMLAKLGQIKFG